jgi:hypothetical protein
MSKTIQSFFFGVVFAGIIVSLVVYTVDEAGKSPKEKWEELSSAEKDALKDRIRKKYEDWKIRSLVKIANGAAPEPMSDAYIPPLETFVRDVIVIPEWEEAMEFEKHLRDQRFQRNLNAFLELAHIPLQSREMYVSMREIANGLESDFSKYADDRAFMAVVANRFGVTTGYARAVFLEMDPRWERLFEVTGKAPFLDAESRVEQLRRDGASTSLRLYEWRGQEAFAR